VSSSPSTRWLIETACVFAWPPALGRAAANAPWWWCGLLGAASIALILAAWGAGSETAGCEPFRDFAHYLLEDADLTLFVALSLFVPLVCVFMLVAGISHARWSLKVQSLARIRACLLAPVACLLPCLAWHACLLIEAAQDPWCSFTWAAKPAWIMWGVFGVGAWILGPAIAAWLVVVAVHGATVAGRLAPSDSSCRVCGYELAGLSGAVCPECGSEGGVINRTG